jgi:hypothetical protein
MPRERKALEGTWWWWRGGSIEAMEWVERDGGCEWAGVCGERRGVCSVVVDPESAVDLRARVRCALDADMLLSLRAWTVRKQSPHGRPYP